MIVEAPFDAKPYLWMSAEIGVTPGTQSSHAGSAQDVFRFTAGCGQVHHVVGSFGFAREHRRCNTTMSVTIAITPSSNQPCAC